MWQWRHNLPTWLSSSVCFDFVLFPLSSLVTGPSFMSISSLVLELRHFLLWEIDQKSGIRNTLVWVFLNIWRLGWVRETYFDTNVSNEMLLNTAKCQGYFSIPVTQVNNGNTRTFCEIYSELKIMTPTSYMPTEWLHVSRMIIQTQNYHVLSLFLIPPFCFGWLLLIILLKHCLKYVRTRFFSDTYFPV